jgi:hypothetical protein
MDCRDFSVDNLLTTFRNSLLLSCDGSVQICHSTRRHISRRIWSFEQSVCLLYYVFVCLLYYVFVCLLYYVFVCLLYYVFTAVLL